MREGLVKVGELCKIRTGKLDANASVPNGAFPFFTCSREPLRINSFSYDCECVLIAGNGDLNVKYYNGKFDAYQRTYILEKKDNKEISIQYLFQFFCKYVETLRRNCIGGVIKYIKLGDLTEALIPLPPISEQQTIVSELDKINEIIDLKKTQLKDLDLLAQSIFYDMFGDPIENPKGWEIRSLKEYIKVVGGYAFKSNNFKEKGIPVLRIGNINSGEFKPTNLVFWDKDDKLSRYKILPGDMVISLTGTVGKSDYGNICILDNSFEEYYLNQRNAKLEIQGNIDKIYLSSILKFDSIKAKLTNINRGVRQANISNKDIEDLRIPLPPLSLQQSFANKIKAIESQKSAIKQSLTEVETLLASRMDYYFN